MAANEKNHRLCRNGYYISKTCGQGRTPLVLSYGWRPSSGLGQMHTPNSGMMLANVRDSSLALKGPGTKIAMSGSGPLENVLGQVEN